MGEINRLIGADATLERASFGATLVTGSATKGAWYKIVLKTGDTVFPAGYKNGDLVQGQASMTFSATNSAQLATFTIAEDVSSWEVTFSKDSVEVTTLADNIKKFRKGKGDAQGTMSGINLISEMRVAGSVANKFLRIVTGDTAGNTAATMIPADGTPYYFRGLLQDDGTTVGETYTFLFGKIEVGGWKAGAAIGDAQTWDSDFTFVDNDPILYMMDVETPTT